jgi:hypothetical protein
MPGHAFKELASVVPAAAASSRVCTAGCLGDVAIRACTAGFCSGSRTCCWTLCTQGRQSWFAGQAKLVCSCMLVHDLCFGTCAASVDILPTCMSKGVWIACRPRYLSGAQHDSVLQVRRDFLGAGALSACLSLHCKVWVLLLALHAQPPGTSRLVVGAFQLRQ